ncbi:MAG: bifunctional N-acetylglucosamine-1-phosphate uridyltransferase/glucosamine-1-phosphate acetyltransferase [Planctomycetota bacterium]
MKPDVRPLAVFVLAAGKGTRLAVGEDAPPKVLVPCLGAPLIEHVQRAVRPPEAAETVVVVGHGAEAVEGWLAAHWPEARTVAQIPQEGTGQAARLALDATPAFRGDVLLVYGDVPQMRTDDLLCLLAHHRKTKAKATLLSGVAEDPGALGRVVRDSDGRFREIVEARDGVGRPEVLALHEFNTGLYVFDADALRPALRDLSRDNRQGEEYATEAVNRLAASGCRVEIVATPEACALLGVNGHEDLARASTVLRRRIVTDHLRRGVAILDPETTVIEIDVEIAPGATIHPFTHVGRGCRIAAGAEVGPFARLRGGAVLEEDVQVGNFVEVKGSTLGRGAKAKHLAYLGDAVVGEKANIGCGTITANYDGRRKHPTIIGPRVRTGSGTVLVAPVTLGEGAITGANAVVLAGRDVARGQTVVGVPARPLPPRGPEGNPLKDAKEDAR